MTEFEKELLKRVESLEIEVKRLRSVKKSDEITIEKAAYFNSLPSDATVGKDYAAFRFGCSEVAVQRSRAGTHKLRPFLKCERPLLWIKSDVDKVWLEHSKSPKEKALEGFAKNTARKRRKSIIKKPMNVAA